MPPPLGDGKVTYVDGTKATLDQKSRDVVEFLAWASEPHLEDAQPHRHPRHPVPAGAGRPDVRREAAGLGRQALGQGTRSERRAEQR